MEIIEENSGMESSENAGRDSKPIRDLLGQNYNFYIPNYQRGYRWSSQQIEDLLNDIYNFMKKEGRGNCEKYCIQPFALMEDKDNKRIDVIDGQQRLTSIYLILKYLGENNLYSITYATREKSKEFLENCNNDSLDNHDSNIDFFHISNAYNTIKHWFEAKKKADEDYDFVDKFKKTFLNDVVYIEHRIKKYHEDDDKKAFTRLNVGKIPLTDAELVKALFLNKTYYKDDEKDLDLKQHELALEWERIESQLQSNEFWLFIYNKINYGKQTRMDYILDLAYKSEKNAQDLDRYETFNFYSEKFNKICSFDDTKEKWDLIWEKYEILNEWYEDYEIFHYVGYLICVNFKNELMLIRELIDKYKSTDKKGFIDSLKSKISTHIYSYKWMENNNGTEWYKYEFETDIGASKRECRDILLLHNIETVVMQNRNLVNDRKINQHSFLRFDFHLYKLERWDIEHIRPNSNDRMKSVSDLDAYISCVFKYFPDLLKKKDNILKGNVVTKKTFIANIDSKIYEKIDKETNMKLNNSEKNMIWNYVLLDSATNREYGNYIYPVKRSFVYWKERGIKISVSQLTKTISSQEDSDVYKSLDSAKDIVYESAFVPVCTRNVFMKSYSAKPANMLYWTKDDAQDYLNDIKMTLKEFLEN